MKFEPGFVAKYCASWNPFLVDAILKFVSPDKIKLIFVCNNPAYIGECNAKF
jgi:hypothetical protein